MHPTPSAPLAQLAQRIRLDQAESELALTIGELRRQMDRQSQMFLGQQQEAPPSRSTPTTPRAPLSLRPVIVDLSGGDGRQCQAKDAPAAIVEVTDDVGEVDDESLLPGRPSPPSPWAFPGAQSTHPQQPQQLDEPEGQRGKAVEGETAETAETTSNALAQGDHAKCDLNPRTSPPCPDVGVARSGTITLSPRRQREEGGSLATTRTMGRGRTIRTNTVRTVPAASRTSPSANRPTPTANKPTLARRTLPRRQSPRPALPRRTGSPNNVPDDVPDGPSTTVAVVRRRRGAAGSHSSPRSLASRGVVAGAGGVVSPRVPSEATFVRPAPEIHPPPPVSKLQAAPSVTLRLLKLRRPLQLLYLPVGVLVRVFAYLGHRERTLPVCRRWVDLGLRAELWPSVAFDARGERIVLCRLLDFAHVLRSLQITDRRDVNLILEAALRRCRRLQHLRLERCEGPGPIVHCGTFTPRSVAILDTPVSTQVIDLLANVVPTMEECTITSNVDQAAVLFGSLLKMALVVDGADRGVPKQLKTLGITFSSPSESSTETTGTTGHSGTLRWRRVDQRGTMSYNRVHLAAEFDEINFPAS